MFFKKKNLTVVFQKKNLPLIFKKIARFYYKKIWPLFFPKIWTLIFKKILTVIFPKKITIKFQKKLPLNFKKNLTVIFLKFFWMLVSNFFSLSCSMQEKSTSATHVWLRPYFCLWRAYPIFEILKFQKRGQILSSLIENFSQHPVSAYKIDINIQNPSNQ